MSNKKGQEEIVGFVLIVIMVAVLIVIFIGFSLRSSQKEEVGNYEIESFLRATLQYTTSCKDRGSYLTIQDLIEGCINREKCLNNDRDNCLVLNEEVNKLLLAGWKIENRPIGGYQFYITSDGVNVIPEIKEGNTTKNYRGGFEEFSKGGLVVDVIFRVYY